MNANFLIIITELSNLVQFPILYSYTIAVLLVTVPHQKMEDAFTTVLRRIALLYRECFAVQNAIVMEMANFHGQKLTKIT